MDQFVKKKKSLSSSQIEKVNKAAETFIGMV